MNKLTIAIFTAARSEYGPLKPLIKSFLNDNKFNIKLLVGGAHLLNNQGNTLSEINEDGFQIDHVFNYLNDVDNKYDIIKANGFLQIQFVEYLSKNSIDLLIVLGDRSELLSVVSTAMLLSIPVAHISGGEITQGSTDNQIRHAITKMSHLHFPATQEYKNNIKKMGEEDWRICVSGEPSLDELKYIKYFKKDELYRMLGLDNKLKLIISTIHPETINNQITINFINDLIEKINNKQKYQILFTASNADIGGNIINENLIYLSKKYKNIHYIKSLGKLRYYSIMKYADMMLGNSSSGIIEAKSFSLPVINLGKRQDGRIRDNNVIDSDYNVNNILNIIENINKLDEDVSNIYGDGLASSRIIQFINEVDFNKLLYKKTIF